MNDFDTNDSCANILKLEESKILKFVIVLNFQ